jgi:MoxR-like ATPase
MAQALRMQGDLQEGILDLKGHAGTGKDVLVKMFCQRTNRPYFSVDCSKWTTEFELSEDVVLEAKDGASYTIKVPSQVLNAITTPGAVLYFNELNAMPEQAQIFLHSLLDEKRSLSLKTSSGQVVKAEHSVLLIDSRNPGYPGTFDLQMATKSRTVSLEIGYPSLEKTHKLGETNTNLRYNSSEALRIARQVKSLEGLTYDPNMERNEFVKLWDKVVNGDQNDAGQASITQKFDLETILALVQFSDKLRDDFIAQYEGDSKAKRNALPVVQPVTGRELRRCAYMLSQMPDAEKVNGNPEDEARELLRVYFISHLDKQADKERIVTSMDSWTSSKRVGV